MIKTKYVAAALCLVMMLPACGRRYVLPKGDGVSEYSPPSLVGHLAEVAPHQVIVDAGDRAVVVPIEPTTRLFKIAGGLVFHEELRVGQCVHVWYDSRRPSGEAAPAAVLMVASLDPNDQLPRPFPGEPPEETQAVRIRGREPSDPLPFCP